MRPDLRLLLLVCTAVAAGCAGRAYLPGEPGGARSDLSGQDVRDLWVQEHPDEPDAIRAAIREGVFIPGMTLEHRDVITNFRRKGATGNGFWRIRTTGDETRYQWHVASQWEPFIDGRQRPVCELVYVGATLTEVQYCSAASGSDGSY